MLLFIHCGSGNLSISSFDTVSVGTLVESYGNLLVLMFGGGNSDLVSCALGGSSETVTTETSITMTYNDCVDGFDLNGNGQIDVTNTTTGSVIFDQTTGTLTFMTSFIQTNLTTGDTTDNLTRGTVALDLTTGESVFDLDGQIGSDDYTQTGSLNSAGGILNGIINFIIGNRNIRCSYTDIDSSTATPNSYAAQCGYAL